MVVDSSLGMTESNPTSLFLHFQHTGSEVVDVDSRCLSVGGLLLDLCLQCTTNATDNAWTSKLLDPGRGPGKTSTMQAFLLLSLAADGSTPAN